MSTPPPAEPGPEAAAEVPAVTEPAPEPVTEPDLVPDLVPEHEPEPKPRPRGRTAKIMAAAVVLGVLGGAGTGYAVQAARTPTPLPPLAVTQPTYPSAHRVAPALTAAQDDMVKTDGDLTKLLVPIPSGAKPWDTPAGNDGWLDLYSLSSDYTKPDAEMRYELSHGFRRAAVQTWMQGSVSYEVDVIQYRHNDETAPNQFVLDGENYARQDAAAQLQMLPHTAGQYGVYAGTKALTRSDGSTYYRGYGFAAHGDLCVQILVFSPNPVDAKPLMTELQNQMERL
ncbi:hypothetical protein [Streptacidiphilus jiangxiensis]|uniref:Uncharacterized protein n=1 Tax=Streptacidiphilus jiangxiensis TaxID=235985 RepID=A0A1H7J6N2_STRJI|nr:hypothetical protein [Streptacidiphilus jiangxiensis]SEK69527.1 hypothetical protein SAMN05414137_103142 [Streptacidiphilus jiangxiensis]